MAHRLFSLAEANRALPLVRAVTTDAVAAYRSAKEAIGALEVLRARQRAGWAQEGEVGEHERRIARRLARLKAFLVELTSLGVRLRDYERGVVDFPADLADGRGPVVFCWELGEDEVGHWHVAGEGDEERRLLESVN